MVCQIDIDVSPITVGWYASLASMSTSSSSDGTLDQHCLHVTVGLNAAPTVMNNATDGSKPAVINNDYHQ